MKKPTAFLIVLIQALTVFAQTPPSQSPQSPPIQSPGQYGQTPPIQAPAPYPQTTASPYSPTRNFNTNEFGIGGITFSNRFGQSYSAEDLAGQLQNLRSAVEQALPVLGAFNENFSNSLTSGRQTVGGALSGIVSGVLHKDQNPAQTATQSSLTTSNLLALLRGVLNTNANGTVGANGTTLQDTIALQNDLQPVAAVLQRLVPGATPNSTSVPYNSTATPAQNPNLTPTGR